MFRQFFGDRMPQQLRTTPERSWLSVIISTDGYILRTTTVDGATIKVDLNDNRTLDAKVVGSDSAQ